MRLPIEHIVDRIKMPACHVEHSGIVYNGDFRHLVEDLPSNCIDLIVTDPPYGISYVPYGCRNASHSNKSLPEIVCGDRYEIALSLVESLCRASLKLLKPGGCLCLSTPAGGRQCILFAQWVSLVSSYLRCKEIVIWDKMRIGLGTHYRKSYEPIIVAYKPGAKCKWNGNRSISNILRHPRPNKTMGDHPTPKPVSLMADLVSLHSDCGDIVLDPFAGHGSTLVAAKLLGRRYVGAELDAYHCAAISHNLETLGIARHDLLATSYLAGRKNSGAGT